jgi:hypothetical protein
MMTEQLSYTLVLVTAIVMIGVVVILAPANAAVTVPFGILIVTGILQLLGQARAATKVAEVAETAKVAATKVEEVAAAAKIDSAVVADVARKQAVMVGTVDETHDIAKATHTLVNSAYGASLRTALLALRQVALLTTDPVAKGVAEVAVVEAQKLYDEHMAKQAQVDAATKGADVSHDRRVGDVIEKVQSTILPTGDIHIKAESVSVEGTGITVHPTDTEPKA